MDVIILFIAVGVLGGLARACYGLLKSLTSGMPINIGYFILTLAIAAGIGGLLGYVFDIDVQIAALAGYVGTDILENVFKGIVGGKNLLIGRK